MALAPLFDQRVPGRSVRSPNVRHPASTTPLPTWMPRPVFVVAHPPDVFPEMAAARGDLPVSGAGRLQLLDNLRGPAGLYVGPDLPEPPVALRPDRVDRSHGGGGGGVLQAVQEAGHEDDLPAAEGPVAGVPYPLRPVGDDDQFVRVVQAPPPSPSCAMAVARPHARSEPAQIRTRPGSPRPDPDPARCLIPGERAGRSRNALQGGTAGKDARMPQILCTGSPEPPRRPQKRRAQDPGSLSFARPRARPTRRTENKMWGLSRRVAFSGGLDCWKCLPAARFPPCMKCKRDMQFRRLSGPRYGPSCGTRRGSAPQPQLSRQGCMR